MTTTPVCIQLDPATVVQALREQAAEMSNRSGGEALLDFSAVPRINPAAVQALEELADRADRVSTKITLRGVNIDIYRVLKLLKLAQRFSFS